MSKLAQLAWLAYFAFTLAIIGLVLAYGVVAPLYFAGYFYAPANYAADRVMRWGIGLLMSVQPWFKSEINFREIPQGGLLLVSNHRSHLDAFILLSRIKGIKIFGKTFAFRISGDWNNNVRFETNSGL